MAIAAGVISLVSKTATQIVLSATAATGAVGPVTQQWYRSTVSGFTPGGGNILSGKTTLSLTDTGLLPGTQYYYKLVYTDTGDSNVTATATQFGASTEVEMPLQNSFDQEPIVGMTDQRYNYDTISCQVDISEPGELGNGSFVKLVDSAGGVPKVIGCTADDDDAWGVIQYDVKSPVYVAGDLCQVGQSGNVVFLRATEAIARGAKATMDVSTIGGVAEAEVGARIAGIAFDKAAAAGDIIRVKLELPGVLQA